MKLRKLTAAVLSMILATAMSLTAAAAPDQAAVLSAAPEAGKIVILHTNDVHCGVEEGVGYAGLAAYRNEMQLQYGADNVTLVDAGDAIQGGALGTLSDGAFLVDTMNQVGYDIAIPGNHEFDYGVENFLDLAQNRADYTYLCSNFVDLTAGTLVLPPYRMIDYSGTQVAYVGIATPETFTKSTPVYFQDEAGNYIYSFCQGNDGADLYANVQASVDMARAQGADYVVAIGHLGTEGITPAWQAGAVIANTSGIDVLIDGHSHEAYEKVVENKDGKDVLLAQTGTKFNAIGKVVIDPSTGDIVSELVEDYDQKEPVTDVFLQALNAGLEDILGQVVAKSDVDLTSNDPATGLRRVRSGETNLGDMVADAYRTVMGAQIGFANGGGIRADLPAGDITYEDIINIHPYGNEMCVVEATGQEILDALELGASHYPQENGGFLHVSGLTYTIDASVPSSVVTTDEGDFVKVDGAYRVTDVKVGGEPLDPAKTYTVASHNYMIKNGGDGYIMFRDNTLLQDCTMLDNQLLIEYITQSLGGTVGEQYANPYGEGRITILNAAD
ncbi:MAG TPA: bifunctional metallophosphatase/5'-nucleotidase [Candidatus Eisenbergiella merdigallinarum]|uniref:Bifunctional metallophosphatase/5'-nucleotidase n=1 Tax=Candidatus Eisenbergiella merdigallinarum TaxID=2838552 RepID=A0A9D2SCH0_9FIRM|nr:bifunctional metallophosphatase/5'-nucleotidase [Candidatus Eisenbergiella merdigallinarum]